MVTTDRRDRRQFKSLGGYPDPAIFPPPERETWHSIGTTAPLPGNSAKQAMTSKARKHAEGASAVTTAAAETQHPTAESLLDMALARGFEITRTTDVHHIKKGTYKFQLPKTGYANQWTTSALVNICSEYDKSLGIRGGKTNNLPTAVGFQNRTWAVVSQNAAQYNIQSLENGDRLWVAKEKVQVLTMDEASPTTPVANNGNHPKQEEAEAEKVFPGITRAAEHAFPEAAAAQPAPAPAPRFPELTSNPLGNWASTTHSAIKALRLDIERDLARIRPKQEQLRELERVYTLVTGNDVEGESPSGAREYKRTVLPPQRAPGQRGGYSPAKDWSEQERVIKQAFIASGRNTSYGYLNGLKDAVKKAGLEVPPDFKMYELMKAIKQS